MVGSKLYFQLESFAISQRPNRKDVGGDTLGNVRGSQRVSPASCFLSSETLALDWVATIATEILPQLAQFPQNGKPIAQPVFDLFPSFKKYLEWHIMLWVVVGEKGGGKRAVNWPQFLTSIPEAFTLAPSPLLLGAWPEQNLKPKAFIISVLKNTLKKKRKKKKNGGSQGVGCCLILCFLS